MMIPKSYLFLSRDQESSCSARMRRGGSVAISLSPRNRTFGPRTAALLAPPWTRIDQWPPALPWPNPSQSPSQSRWGISIAWQCRWKRWQSIGRERWRQPRTCTCHGIRSVHALRHQHYLSKIRRPTQRLGHPLHYRAPTLHQRCSNASPEFQTPKPCRPALSATASLKSVSWWQPLQWRGGSRRNIAKLPDLLRKT